MIAGEEADLENAGLRGGSGTEDDDAIALSTAAERLSESRAKESCAVDHSFPSPVHSSSDGAKRLSTSLDADGHQAEAEVVRWTSRGRGVAEEVEVEGEGEEKRASLRK
jgi:hypothetical protein